MAPKTHVLNVCSPMQCLEVALLEMIGLWGLWPNWWIYIFIHGFIPWWHLWEVVATKRWGLVGGSRSLGATFWMVYLSLDSSLVTLPPDCHEVSSFPPACPSNVTFLAASLKEMNPTYYGLKPVKSWTKTNNSVKTVYLRQFITAAKR
jgi:hypothetical protein